MDGGSPVIIRAFDSRSIPSHAFLTGNGLGNVRDDPSQGAAGCYSGLPNGFSALGHGSFFPYEYYINSGVQDGSNVMLVESFKIGINKTIYDGTNDFDVRMSIKPTRVAGTTDAAFDGDAYYIESTTMSAIDDIIDADGYITVTPPTPVEVSIDPTNLLWVTIETDPYSSSVNTINQIDPVQTQVWARTSYDNDVPRHEFRLPSGGLAGIDVWAVLTSQLNMLDIVVEGTTCPFVPLCDPEFIGCDGLCYSVLPDEVCNGAPLRDITEDCDASDDAQCQMEDACGTCGAVIAEGWPPGEGVSFVVEEWDDSDAL
jgi:hypothetical protein